MARCARCNKFMLIVPKSGFCKNCELLNAQDKAKEEQSLQEKRKAEEKRKAKELARKKAEEEYLKKAEEARRAAEAAKAAEEERVMINSFYTKLAGVTFSNEGVNTESRQRIIHDLSQREMLKCGQELELRPTPQNRFDHQAVAVFGPDGRQLGFLPKEVAHRIFSKLQATGGYSAFVASVTGGDAGFSYGVNVRVEEYQVIQKQAIKMRYSNSESIENEDDDEDYKENYKDYYEKDYEDNNDDYGNDDNGMLYDEESWYESHLNPYGTIDCGDGYVDDDGVFTEY